MAVQGELQDHIAPVAKPVRKKKVTLMMHGDDGGRYMSNEEIDLFIKRTKEKAEIDSLFSGWLLGAFCMGVIWFLTFLVSHLHWV